MLEPKQQLKKISKKLMSNVYKAVHDYFLIEEGDKVMVCLSGGKDSYTMLDMLMNLQKSAPFSFEIVAVNLDQKQPGFPEHILPAYLEGLNVPFKIVEKDTYSVVKSIIPEGKTMCSLCSRLRRGTLYETAKELGCTKIALGHHREDIIETAFLNMFFAGKLETMPVKLITNDKANIVIRPLAYCSEEDIQTYSDLREFPIIPCTLCGSQENMQRKKLKQMMNDWSEKYPHVKESIFKSLTNIAPSHLLDTDLFDFDTLTPKVGGVEKEVGDYMIG